MKNIGWYTRDGDLNFFALLSQRLTENGNNIKSHFVCHTRDEERRLRNDYNNKPWVLGDYIKSRNNSFNWDEKILRELENKYNDIPLRRLIWGEMYEKNFTENQLIILLISHFEFWEKFISENNIQGVVSEVPAILSTNILWVICKKLNIPFISPVFTGIEDWSSLTSSWYGYMEDFAVDILDEIEINKKSDTYEKSLKYYEKMIKTPEISHYVYMDLETGEKRPPNKLVKNFPKLPNFGNILLIPAKIKKLRERNTYFLNETIFEKYRSWFFHFLRILYIQTNYLFEKNLNLSNEKYVLFNLNILHEWQHYCAMGLKYPNILNFIEDCSACLPLGYKLYVKEHPYNFPEKSISFYRSLKKNPRVRLLHGNENNFELIKNSEAVISLGGTTGWESFLLGKQLIIMANIWYSHLPGVYKVDSPEKLVDLLQKITKLPVATKEKIIQAIYSHYKSSFEAKLYPHAEQITKSNLEQFVTPFENWLRNEVGLLDTKTS